MKRLFVAVWPPEAVLDRVAALPRPATEGLRWTSREHWHVTLRFLGPVPAVEPVAEALAALPRLELTTGVLGPATRRFDQRILHVPVGGLDDVAAAVIGATAHIGKPPDDRPFHGHLTLARVAKHAKVDLRPLTGTPVAETWTVDEVCVAESFPSSSGARYEVRLRVPLADPHAVRST